MRSADPRRGDPTAAAASPEPARQRRAIQVIALAAIVVSVAYLVWRAAFTLGADLWLAIPLWLLELHAVTGLGLFAFSLWDLDAAEHPAPVTRTGLRVAVLIPTYNEARQVLVPTVAAAVDLQPAHETWVLDDGARPWVRQLATQLGARYLARPDNTHAKAGNLNYALDRIDADVVGVLDADHVPTSGFLSHTLGYFDDPGLAVVQTPQDFYNLDSFEHARNRSWLWPRRRSIAYNEQRLFYRALEPGKNRWNAAFWCGTSALVRTAALRDIGGVAQETVTEDIHTTIRMHRRGWRSVFHNEVLAHGLAAGDAEQYQAQRRRWGMGAMQLLRVERPLTGPGLTLAQRVAYGATLLGWFDAWRTLGYVLMPLVVLFSGALPVAAPLPTFAAVFGGVFVAQRVALSLLARGYAPQGLATLFDFIRMQTNLTATLSWLHQGERRFRVTDKGGSAQRRRIPAPRLLWMLCGLSLVAGSWFGLSLAGLTPTTYPIRWTAYGAAGWAVVNLAFLLTAIRRIRDERFAADRRAGVRLQAGGTLAVNGQPAELVDISVGGALIRCARPPASADAVLNLEFSLAWQTVVLVGRQRSQLLVGAGGALLGVEFEPGQDREAARLVVSLLDSTSHPDALRLAA